MKKILSFSLILLTIAGGAFAVASLNANVGISTVSATPTYTVGVTLKSIGALGLELTVEGNMGSSFDLGKIGNIKQWNLMPTLFISLPTGEIRPYAGIGILTIYDVPSSSFGPISFETLYYKAGVDVFLNAFSFFAEAQGTLNYHPAFNVSGIKEWRIGAGLAF